MAMTSFVCVPDMHLGAFGSMFPDLENPDDLVYEGVAQVVNHAYENGIKNIIFLGDIFDKAEPTHKQIKGFLAFLLTLNKFEVYIIPGNHDYEHIVSNSLEIVELITGADLLPNIHLYMKPTSVSIDGVPFCFLPWPHSKKKNLTKKPSINIAHLELNGAVTDSGRLITHGVELNTDTDYWVIGHLHQKQSKGKVYYPGTLYQKNFGESLPKGFMSANVTYSKNKLRMKTKWHSIKPPFELKNMRVTTPKQLLEIEPYDITKRPLIRYKLFMNQDVGVPPNFLRDNPHIVNNKKWKSVQEAEQLEQGSVNLSLIEAASVKDMLIGDLAPFLKEKGLNKQERKRAYEIVTNIATELKLFGA